MISLAALTYFKVSIEKRYGKYYLVQRGKEGLTNNLRVSTSVVGGDIMGKPKVPFRTRTKQAEPYVLTPVAIDDIMVLTDNNIDELSSVIIIGKVTSIEKKFDHEGGDIMYFRAVCDIMDRCIDGEWEKNVHKDYYDIIKSALYRAENPYSQDNFYIRESFIKVGKP